MCDDDYVTDVYFKALTTSGPTQKAIRAFDSKSTKLIKIKTRNKEPNDRRIFTAQAGNKAQDRGQ